MMRYLIMGACTLLLAVHAHASEVRGGLGLGFGTVSYESDAGDELFVDTSQTAAHFRFYSDQSGPFFGASLSKLTFSDYELNGMSLGMADGKADNTSLTVGYRGGQYGEPQFFGSATFGRTKIKNGGSDSFSSFAVGLEQTFPKGRLGASVVHAREDSFKSFGMTGEGILYLTENVGVGAYWGWALGNGEMLGVDVDGRSWEIGLGVEFRLKP